MNQRTRIKRLGAVDHGTLDNALLCAANSIAGFNQLVPEFRASGLPEVFEQPPFSRECPSIRETDSSRFATGLTTLASRKQGQVMVEQVMVNLHQAYYKNCYRSLRHI